MMVKQSKLLKLGGLTTLFLFLLVLSSISVSATGEWENYQYNGMHWGYTGEVVGGMDVLPTSSVTINAGTASETPL